MRALTQAASISVPKVKCGSLKHYWDDELSELKRLSIKSHSMWVEAGRPRSGDTYNNRTRDKFKYKTAINERKLAEKMSVLSELHDSLQNKQSKAFWRT